MAGNVVPGASQRMLMRYARPGGGSRPPTLPHAQAPRGRGGTSGSNPFAGGNIQYDAEGNPILPPTQAWPGGPISGLFGHMIMKGEQEDFASRLKGAHEASQAHIGDALKVYDAKLAETGDHRQAAIAAATANDNAVFKDPDAMKALSDYHQLQQSGQGYSVEALGHGINVVHGPGGDQLAHEPPAAKEGRPQYIQTDKGLMTPDPNDPTKLIPTTSGGEAVGPKPSATGARYMMTADDERYIGGAPSVLSSLDLLKDAGKDAQGFIRGPAGQLFARLFGTNDPAKIWGAARDNLERELISGKVPGAYAGPLKEYLGTLPKVWHAAPYDTTNLNVMSHSLRDDYTNRASFVEAHNGGRPIPIQDQLRSVGVYPPSLGWSNPRALLAAGTPEALSQLQPRDAVWLYQHQNELPPNERQALEQVYQQRQQEYNSRHGVNPAPAPQLQAPQTPGQPQAPQPAPAPQVPQPAPETGPLGPSAQAPIPPAPQTQAPIPAPNAAPQPAPPPQRQGFLDQLNPIAAAQAAEAPPAPMQQAQEPAPPTDAYQQLSPEERSQSAGAAIPLAQAASEHSGFDAADFQRLRDAGVGEDILKTLPVAPEPSSETAHLLQQKRSLSEEGALAPSE